MYWMLAQLPVYINRDGTNHSSVQDTGPQGKQNDLATLETLAVIGSTFRIVDGLDVEYLMLSRHFHFEKQTGPFSARELLPFNEPS